jgi:hypothetical protein
MVVVRWLEPDVDEDLAFATAVTDVVNRAYTRMEVGLFATKIERTDIDDVRTSISRRETAVALLEGAVVGLVRSRALDGRTGWFGALGVDPAGTAEGLAKRSSGSWRTTRPQLGEVRCSSKCWRPNRYIPTCRESGSGTSDAGTARRHASHFRIVTTSITATSSLAASSGYSAASGAALDTYRGRSRTRGIPAFGQAPPSFAVQPTTLFRQEV